MSPELEDCTCQSHDGKEAICQLLVARCHPAELLQTQNTTRHHVALAILALVKHHWTPSPLPPLHTSLLLTGALRDQMPDTTSTQQSATGLAGIAPVQTHFTRTLFRTTPSCTLDVDAIEHRLQLWTIGTLAFTQHQRQRTRSSGRAQMDFGRDSSPTTTEALV